MHTLILTRHESQVILLHENIDKPFLLWYRPWYGVDAARDVGLAGEMATEDGADKVERQDHEYADARDGNLR